MPHYIRDLRTLVGRRPLIMVGAAVMVFDAQERLLLQHRSDNGAWGLLGGSMELGESAEETARREAFEEAGVSVGQLTLFDVFSGREQFYEYPNGDQVYNVCVVYTSHDFQGEPRPSAEGTEVHFFALDQLPQPISPPDVPILQRLTADARSR